MGYFYCWFLALDFFYSPYNYYKNNHDPGKSSIIHENTILAELQVKYQHT